MDDVLIDFFYSCSEKTVKKSRKSSKELYQEATDMLGISCTFSDNCRCLDCQVINPLLSINELTNNFVNYCNYRVDTLTVMMIVTHIQIYLMLLSMKMMIY